MLRNLALLAVGVTAGIGAMGCASTHSRTTALSQGSGDALASTAPTRMGGNLTVMQRPRSGGLFDRLLGKSRGVSPTSEAVSAANPVRPGTRTPNVASNRIARFFPDLPTRKGGGVDAPESPVLASADNANRSRRDVRREPQSPADVSSLADRDWPTSAVLPVALDVKTYPGASGNAGSQVTRAAEAILQDAESGRRGAASRRPLTSNYVSYRRGSGTKSAARTEAAPAREREAVEDPRRDLIESPVQGPPDLPSFDDPIPAAPSPPTLDAAPPAGAQSRVSPRESAAGETRPVSFEQDMPIELTTEPEAPLPGETAPIPTDPVTPDWAIPAYLRNQRETPSADTPTPAPVSAPSVTRKKWFSFKSIGRRLGMPNRTPDVPPSFLPPQP